MMGAGLFSRCGAMCAGRGASDMAAEEVRTRLRGTTLNGELMLTEGKQLEDGVTLLVHGTLAHNKMELIANLQRLLAARGVSTLADQSQPGGQRPPWVLRLRAAAHASLWRCESRRSRRGSAGSRTRACSISPSPVTAWAGRKSRRLSAGNDDPAITAMVLLAPATFDAGARGRGLSRALRDADLAEIVTRAQA